jgi:hypothetical protein
MGAEPCQGEVAYFLCEAVWVKMITLFKPDLTTGKVIPEMPKNEALADRWHPTRRGASPTLLISILILGGSTTLATPAMPADEFDWLTGSGLDQQMDSPMESLHWGSNPLRRALDSLARSQRVAIFLDRRIDPGQPIDLSVQNQPLRVVIHRLADFLRIGVCRVGPVVFFGPRPTTEVLEAALESRRNEIQRWPPAFAKRLLTARPAAWPELAEPRQLIQDLGDRSQLEIEGLERVPHDLWPAADLPPLDFAEHMSLLLAGFDLTFQPVDGAPRIRLVPLPVAEIEDRVVESGETKPRQSPPKKDRPSKPPATPGGEVRYTLEVQNQPVGPVTQALASQLGLQIELAPQTQGRLDRRVSFQVKEATIDALLQALLEPAGLTYRLSGQVLTVLVKPDGDD